MKINKVISLSERLNQRWGKQVRRRQQIREQYLAAKTPMRCKCPKCEKVHESHLQWSGRGMPRVFCNTCRPIVSSVCEVALFQSGSGTAKNVHRGAYMGFD